jgi:glutathione synthase
MPLNIAVQMDPIDKIDITGDSTFAMMLEAQKRGHKLFYYTPFQLSAEGSVLRARGHDVVVHDKVGAHVEIGPERSVDLSTMDVVLLRQDPPFDMSYITNTHLLERIHPKTLVVNDPKEVRNAPEKIWVLEFQDLMPATLVTRDVKEILAFRAKHKDIIVKPLYGNGGAGVFRVQPNDTNLGSLLEMFQAINREPVMVQQYRAEVRGGDKRIILVDGEVAGAINRVPLEGETRSNMHAGGVPKSTEITQLDMAICKRLGPELKRRGLIFTGIDVIGPFLTEINVTSPTGIRQVKAFGGADIAAMIFDAIDVRRKGV